MSSSTALGARPKAKPMPPAEGISPRQQLLRNARLALRPLHLQRLREEGLHEYLMKPKAHFVFGCPWPPGHPFGTKHEVEALKHAEKVHHYEPKTSAEGRMLSLEEFLNSFPKNQQKKKKEEKKKNTVPVPSRGNLQPRTPTPRPTSRPSSTRDRPRSPSGEPPRSSTWDPPSWSTWGTPSSSTWEPPSSSTWDTPSWSTWDTPSWTPAEGQENSNLPAAFQNLVAEDPRPAANPPGDANLAAKSNRQEYLERNGKKKREVARTKIGIVPSMAKATTRSE